MSSAAAALNQPLNDSASAGGDAILLSANGVPARLNGIVGLVHVVTTGTHPGVVFEPVSEFACSESTHALQRSH
jgi:hypothetical protein